MSVAWVVPEVLVALPVLVWFYIVCNIYVAFSLDQSKGCKVCQGFSVIWLAVLESVLVYRTLPGLLEKAGVERSGEGEDIEILEHKVRRALVKYKED